MDLTSIDTNTRNEVPFNSVRLDGLMEEAGLDVIIASSRPNVRYLMGGYTSHFFRRFESMGVSRFFPLFVYFKGRVEDATYIGHILEKDQRALGEIWVAKSDLDARDVGEAIDKAVALIRTQAGTRIGVEFPFMPMVGAARLKAAMPHHSIADACRTLEKLRMIKSPQELDYLRRASEGVVNAMLSVFPTIRPGMTKRDVVNEFTIQQQAGGLDFEYCLIAAGKNFNRAPSDQIIEAGDIVSLDSGACYNGYIGDLCRMGVVGAENAEMRDLLADVDRVQQAARGAVRPGRPGGDIYTAVAAVLQTAPHRSKMDFVAHGMGLVSHESPRLTDKGPVPYDAPEADAHLQPGMVLSIETSLSHPEYGFIKLEDTVAVTGDGHIGYGDDGRGWNICNLG